MGPFFRSRIRRFQLSIMILNTLVVVGCNQQDNEVQRQNQQLQSAETQGKAHESATDADFAVINPVVSCESLEEVDLVGIGGEGSLVKTAKLHERDGIKVCEVEAMLAPSIGFRTILPMETWTQRYLQLGCGGLCGNDEIRSMQDVSAADGCMQVQEGRFVLSKTDMGHQGMRGIDWAKDPQKRIDFAYRANHLTAVASKQIIAAFYGQSEHYSYFSGCSEGGRSAINEAQRYPDDFDGILAGAPAMLFPVLNSYYHNWMAVSNLDEDGKPILLAENLPILAEAAVAQCDQLDGLQDGLIADPRACEFDPSVVQCAQADNTEACLTAQQVEVAQKFYRGPQDPDTGMDLALGGPQPGSELSWQGVFVPRPGSNMLFSEIITRDGQTGLIYEQPLKGRFTLDQLEFTEAGFDRIRPLYGLYGATNPDLKAFKESGGKLMLWHGWSDQHISPINSIAYFEAVEELFGKEATAEFAKFYLLPGMYHCGGGTGPSSFDMLTELMAWVEKGQAPFEIVASVKPDKGMPSGTPSGGEDSMTLSEAAVRTRPVYPYPLIPSYSGEGSIDEASSFKAVEGARGPEVYNWAGQEFYLPGRQLDCRVKSGQLDCSN